MKKKMLAMLLTATMGLACLSACGNEEGETTSKPSENNGSTPASQEAASADKEETEAPRKLTICLAQDPLVTDYDDNTLTQKIKEELDCEIEFMILPAEDAATKLSLMMTSGEKLPDVVLGIVNDSMLQEFGSLGKFVCLDEYYSDPEKMPNLWALDEEGRELMTLSATQPDGHIYGMTGYIAAMWNESPHRYFINKTWLDNLGLNMPTTTDELKEVLIAFRDKDPNGNGEKDEIPFVSMTSGYGRNGLAALMNAFTFWNAGDMNYGLALSEDGSTVIAPFVQDEWREGLAYMHDLFEEGLISPETFTMDTAGFKTILNNENANIVGLTVMGGLGNYVDVLNNANYYDMELMAPVSGPEGVCYTPATIIWPNPLYAITSDCENVDLAVAFGDLMYDFGYSTSMRYGEEGVDWSRDAADLAGQTGPYIEAGFIDEPSVVLLNDIWSQPSNHYWRIQLMYYSPEYFAGVVNMDYDPADPKNYQQVLFGEHYSLYYRDKHPEHLLPKINYTEEQTKELQDTLVSLPDYVKMAMSEFIIGTRDVDNDKDWENYLKDLEQMGLPKLLEYTQTNYDK